MNKIPTKLRQEMNGDPYYCNCARRKDGDCGGRITWEHVFIFKGKQIQEKWAIIPLCEKHHGVGIYWAKSLLDKRKNEWISINRATAEDLKKYPKHDWEQAKKYLNKKFL